MQNGKNQQKTSSLPLQATRYRHLAFVSASLSRAWFSSVHIYPRASSAPAHIDSKPSRSIRIFRIPSLLRQRQDALLTLPPGGNGARPGRYIPLIVVACAAARSRRLLLFVVLKVRVVDGALGGDAAGGVVDEHGLEQVEAGRVEVVAERGRVISLPLGKGGLEIGIRGDAGPDVFRGGSKGTEGWGQSQ